MKRNAKYYENEFLKKSAEDIGNSWGKDCWKEVKEKSPLTYEKTEDGTACSQDFICLNCCKRKEKSCGKKYPHKRAKCEKAGTFCADVAKK